jgi:hypothetical protein
MANQTETLHLASTLADFDPVFLAMLEKSVESWITKNAKGPASLGWMVPFCQNGHVNELRALLAALPVAKLNAFALKLDKHHPTLGSADAEQKIDHIIGLATGQIEPAPRPRGTAQSKSVKSGNGKSAPKMQLEEIVRIGDVELRRKELTRLSDAALKKQVRDIGMDVPAGLKKTERIQFIQEELAAGWPKPRSILDSSRY